MVVLQKSQHTHDIRGDDTVKIKGNVVKDYMLGNTRMIFCDDYVVRTKEEEEKILKEFYQEAWECIHILIERGEEV
ncbi:hypothetical protein [Chengkuizengella axinellae]|uniref:Uncharacterized protein n=1 Tax=Chengkuizengella axinellae TaxID=3064388 RepID=A0ABT9J230_9BACL|nr:hypothetical protein [Chengkuizengella sp. 2205SS18-9]MDP5275070.1 hypothetical protein [Chengkuizengella sp. 2205SS18-9]